MRYFFFLSLVFLCIHCITKPPVVPVNISTALTLRDSLTRDVDSITIERLSVGLLEGVPASLQDGTNISIINIDSVSVSLDDKYRIKNRILKLGLVRIDTAMVAPGSGSIVEVLPYQISSLVFAKITFIKNGKKVVTISKPLHVVKFNIEKYDVQYDAVAPVYDKLKFKIKDLEERIIALLKEIEKLQNKEPDHAGRELPPTLNRLLKRVKAIKEYYKDREAKIIENSIRVDLNELDKIEYTVETQEDEVKNPDNTPLAIENELLFESGKYDILESVAKLDAIVMDINNKIKNIQSKYPGIPVKVALAVTGYADEQDVISDLKYKLYKMYPSAKSARNNETQEFLNKLLSQARADNVFGYIKRQIAPSSQLTSTEFIETGAIGKGWQLPIKVTPPCKGDCQQRRVVYISHIVFPESGK